MPDWSRLKKNEITRYFPYSLKLYPRYCFTGQNKPFNPNVVRLFPERGSLGIIPVFPRGDQGNYSGKYLSGKLGKLSGKSSPGKTGKSLGNPRETGNSLLGKQGLGNREIIREFPEKQGKQGKLAFPRIMGN